MGGELGLRFGGQPFERPWFWRRWGELCLRLHRPIDQRSPKRRQRQQYHLLLRSIRQPVGEKRQQSIFILKLKGGENMRIASIERIFPIAILCLVLAGCNKRGGNLTVSTRRYLHNHPTGTKSNITIGEYQLKTPSGWTSRIFIGKVLKDISWTAPIDETNS